MEIETAPRHPAPTPWGRLLLSVVLFGPVTLLVLLPIGLGLERYVMTGSSMEGGIDRGSIAFERVVPVSDLRVGDVITYAHPGAGADQDAMVTHRIVSIRAEGIRTQGDAEAAFAEQLRSCRRYGFRWPASEGLFGMAAVAAARHANERAARLLGAAYSTSANFTRWLAGKAKVLLVRRNAGFEIINRDDNVIESLRGEGAISCLTE